MPEISPIRSDQVDETRRMIYAVANSIFHDGQTIDEAIVRYSEIWPLPDLDEIQQHYIDTGGIFLVMMDNGRVIGSGALRYLEPKVCEIKRLWFLPEYQGKGHGYRMMIALLDFARQHGYEIARLETSPTYQPRAYAFYHKLGFYDIPSYSDDEDDVGMEMRL